MQPVQPVNEYRRKVIPEENRDGAAPGAYDLDVNILITGFVPWGKNRVNPSGEIARELGGHLLPVDSDAASRELRRLIRKHRPEAVLMIGLAASRKTIALEAVALNVEHHDEKGKDRRWLRPIRPRGPLALETRLPLKRIHARLREAGIRASISHHAGTFVCNRVFYEGLSACTVPCGFVHVPPFTAMPQPRQIRAIRTILRAIGGSSPEATR
jgi:pyroglutamyl-peptidase